MSLDPEYIRKIIHIDMDAFYASVEQRDKPELRGKPVAVGGSRERGVVAAASYEAREFGIHSAMASSLAFRRCPEIIFVKPNFANYKAVSQQIRAIFYEYTDLVEPLSLDEAYLDVTENKKGISTATKIAKEIRQRIWEETELRASAGISINKFIAKVASDINKPNGQKTILPEEALGFLEELPIGKFYGIGKKTAEKMKFLGIHRGKDLKVWSKQLLHQEFGKAGESFFEIVRAQQNSKVTPSRPRKSLGAETTYSKDLVGETQLKEALHDLFLVWFKRLEHSKQAGKTITLKFKDNQFNVHSRSISLDKNTLDENILWQNATHLLLKEEITEPIRLLGLSLSNFSEDKEIKFQQLTINF
jgi:DNA polymerase-4